MFISTFNGRRPGYARGRENDWIDRMDWVPLISRWDQSETVHIVHWACTVGNVLRLYIVLRS